MKIKVTILLIGVLLGFNACNNKSDPKVQDVVLLTYNVPNGDTSTTDDWVFASDQAGNILDLKPFEASQTIVLKNSKVLSTDKINITFFNKDNAGDFHISSYLAFPVGQTWTYVQVPYYSTLIRPLLGKTKVILNNFTNTIYDFAPSDSYGGLSSATTITTNTLTSNINLFSNDKIFISTLRNSIPVYYELNNPTVGNTYTPNLSTDFKTFDHTINFDPTGASNFKVLIYASNNNGQLGFAHTVFTPTTGTGIRSVGYNDGFSSYYTEIDTEYKVTGTYPFVDKNYLKVGKPITTAPTLLNYTFDVTNGSVGNFVFSISGNYTSRTSLWDRNISGLGMVYHYVYAPSGAQQILSLPKEIQSIYPALDLSMLNHQNSTFYLNLDGTTYESQYAQNTGRSKEYLSIEFLR